MLPNIVIDLGCGVIETLIPGIRKVFLIFGPRDALCIEEVNNGRYICGNLNEVIIVHAEIVASHHGTVVWLGRMCHSVEIIQKDAFASQILQIRVSGGRFVVL